MNDGSSYAYILWGYLLVSLLYWLRVAYGVTRVRSVEDLSELRSPEPAVWPKLSVVLPACNEADKLAPAARTLLEEDYPDLEIVFVDDRSSDATGEMADGLASRDGRVRAIHVTELPEGRVAGLAAGGRHLARDAVSLLPTAGGVAGPRRLTGFASGYAYDECPRNAVRLVNRRIRRFQFLGPSLDQRQRIALS